MLVVCAGRDELLGPARRDGLPRRSPRPSSSSRCRPIAADELVAGLLGGRHLPPPLQARLSATAEGNPLFLTETVAMLVEDGQIRQTDDGWDFADGLAEVPLPPTVQALVAARLDLLAPGDRLLAEVASVIGRTFGDDELAALDGSGADADRAGPRGSRGGGDRPTRARRGRRLGLPLPPPAPAGRVLRRDVQGSPRDPP